MRASGEGTQSASNIPQLLCEGDAFLALQGKRVAQRFERSFNLPSASELRCFLEAKLSLAFGERASLLL
jgi:hypothetical protein